MTTDDTKSLPIDAIYVPEDRARSFDPEWAEALSGLIAHSGLLHPITVRRDGDRYRLVAGRRRLAACKLLGKLRIPCRISDANSDDDARLEEVMENLGRQELIALDRCQHLYELKLVWERKYPHTAHGGDTRSEQAKTKRQTLPFDPNAEEIFGFARANAEKVGLSQRTIRLAVAIWEGLSQASRDRLGRTDLARKQTELKALSELCHKQQAEVLDLVLGEADVTNVAGALEALEGGVVPNAVEKQLAALRKQVSALPEPVFDRLIIDNADRIIAALRRQGRLS